MRNLRNAVVGMAVLAMMVSLSGLALAETGCGIHKGDKSCKMDKESCAARIKTLKDSAAALQATNPDLAKGLSDLADKKTEMMQKWQEQKDKHDARTNLLKDSAAQGTNLCR